MNVCIQNRIKYSGTYSGPIKSNKCANVIELNEMYEEIKYGFAMFQLKRVFSFRESVCVCVDARG